MLPSVSNGYPEWFIKKSSTQLTRAIVPTAKKPIFFSSPYYERSSEEIAQQVKKAMESAHTHVKAIPFFKTVRLSSNGRKDPIPTANLTNVVYKFDCVCGADYIGRTARPLHRRIAEHIPKWSRDNKKLGRTASSSITRHLMNCDVNNYDFKLLRRCYGKLELATTDAAAIHFLRPTLCLQKEFVFNLSLILIVSSLTRLSNFSF